MADAPDPASDAGAENRQRDPWAGDARDYIERLARHLGKRGKSAHTVAVPIGKVRLLVSPLEQELAFAAVEGRPEPERLRRLIRDALGMRVKITADLRNLANASTGDERAEARMAAKRSADLGQLLAYELHTEIASLSRRGAIDEAKSYAEYRRSLVEMAEHAADMVARSTDDFQLPEGVIGTGAMKATAGPRPNGAAAATPSTVRAAAPAPKDDAGEGPAGPSNRAKIITLAVLLVLLAAVFAFVLSRREPRLDSFNLNDFKNVPAVIQVVNRAPHLIVVVDRARWEGLSRLERANAVQTVVDAAALAGYRSVEFRTESQANVALWKKGEVISLP